MSWVAGGDAPDCPGAPQTVGHYRSGATTFGIVVDGAWHAKHPMLRVDLSAWNKAPQGTWHHDVLEVAKAMAGAAALTRWRREDGGIAMDRQYRRRLMEQEDPHQTVVGRLVLLHWVSGRCPPMYSNQRARGQWCDSGASQPAEEHGRPTSEDNAR